MTGIGAAGSGGASAVWQRMAAYRDAARDRRSVSAVTDTSPAVGTPGAASRTTAGTAAPLPLVGTAGRLPTERDLESAADQLVRMRIRYPGAQAVPEAVRRALGVADDLIGPDAPGSAGGIGGTEGVGKTECQTCANRKYQDGSDDPGVSFKSPTAMDPDRAATAVRGHEQEHVVRERAEAQREGRKVVSQSVTIHTDICPECGRVYVSGGVTRTVTASDDAPDPSGTEGRVGFEAVA